MRKLSKIVVPAMLAASLFGFTGTASAQSWHDRGHDQGRYSQARYDNRADMIRSQINDLNQRINRNDRRNHISERESNSLRRDLRSLNREFARFNRDGLNNREVRVLQSRINNLRVALRMERTDWNGHRS